MPRPREFDTETALDNAMQAFWNHGYEATSLSDLMDAMSLQKGSIYKAFGDKHSLFVSSLEQYLDHTYESDKRLLNGSSSAYEALKKWLHEDNKFVCGQSLKRGCLMVNAINELAFKDEEVSKIIKVHLKKLSKLLILAVERAQAQREIRNDLTPKSVASMLLTQLIGMVTLSKGMNSQQANKNNIDNLFLLLKNPN